MSNTTDQIDAVVDALWSGVVAQQSGYHAQRAVYYQLMWTHAAVPTDYEPPDNLDDRPTDQPAHPIQGLPETMRSRMKIDTYGKPDGWVMTLETSIDGDVWSRSIDCGVDASRSAAWAVVPTLPPE